MQTVTRPAATQPKGDILIRNTGRQQWFWDLTVNDEIAEIAEAAGLLVESVERNTLVKGKPAIVTVKVVKIVLGDKNAQPVENPPELSVPRAVYDALLADERIGPFFKGLLKQARVAVSAADGI